MITGATSGIGLAAATEFCRHGAFVIGTGRSDERIRRAADTVTGTVPGANIVFVRADLSRPINVQGMASEIEAILIRRHCPNLDILINNAGTYSGKRIMTEDGIEKTFAVNHLAPFYLSLLLLPLLERSGDGRILTVSSSSHYRTILNLRRITSPLWYNGLSAYKASKLCTVLFTLEFNRRYTGSPVRAFALDPGLVSTDIGLKQKGRLSYLVWKLRSKHGLDPFIPVCTMLETAGMEREKLYNSGGVYLRDRRTKRPSRTALRLVPAGELWNLSLKLCREESTEGA